ncbi:acetyltransferase [Amantichitinum ursilacus]|uniref:UDP-N-acetylbacillosamine N-acetyltransferase n=1 Tax=Amantichitinum ursilacus TaxID=857265 RepID=A0A0N0XKV0_9NEIS|nr:acetyltransferase [Amantichitinum ursilacus]KPC52696.1 UDP-N-acetylbacillosamine N-acetyltransferase [Amantichitinum ursilacus]
MKQILLLGANNPESPRMLKRVREATGAQFAGYIDNDPAKAGTDFYGLPIFGGFEVLPRFSPQEYDFVNLISGDCHTRHRTTQTLRDAGFELANLIHPQIDLDMVQLGRGIYLREGVIVQAGVQLADNVCMHMGALIGHETTVGVSSFIAPGVNVCGLVQIGKGVFIGAGATIMPRLKIGDWAIIGAGALINRDVPAGAVMVGNPARVLKTRDIAALNNSSVGDC